MRGVRKALPILIVVLALLATQAGLGRGTAAWCKGSALTAHFAAVRGSEGAGNIVYKLTLRNHSSSSCSLRGLPVASLRGRTGKKLPTTVTAASQGALIGVLVTVAPGQTAFENARFSPDVPGVGEKTIGACEPKAYSLVVTPTGGGTTTAKIAPPTSVCEHGRLQFSAYARQS